MAKGEASPALAAYEHEELAIEEIASLAPLLKRRQITHVVMAGGIERRPRLRAIRPSLSLIKLMPRLVLAMRRGDDGILRALIDFLQSHDIKVVGAHEILPELLAPGSRIGGPAPLRQDWVDIDAAYAAARAIGALDIGQGAVAIGGRVIALEGIEGTDGLLARVRDLRSHGRIAGYRRGVLVKCAKPGQEERADLPSIGPDTIVGAHAAGLAGVGVEAGRSLVLDYPGVVEQADRLGLFVLGLER
jgi:DUF1009 family protein